MKLFLWKIVKKREKCGWRFFCITQGCTHIVLFILFSPLSFPTWMECASVHTTVTNFLTCSNVAAWVCFTLLPNHPVYAIHMLCIYNTSAVDFFSVILSSSSSSSLPQSDFDRSSGFSTLIFSSRSPISTSLKSRWTSETLARRVKMDGYRF